MRLETFFEKCRSPDGVKRNPEVNQTEKGNRARSAPLCLCRAFLSLPRFPPGGTTSEKQSLCTPHFLRKTRELFLPDH